MQRSRIKIFALALGAALLLCGCGEGRQEPSEAPATPAPTAAGSIDAGGEGMARISELMVKNRCALRSADGGFYDWIEIENISDEPLTLTGWQLSDREDKTGFVFPETVLGPGEMTVVFASKAESGGDELHAPFALSAGESVYLRSASGHLVDSAYCADTEADVSLCASGDGSFAECLYPTPGLPNTGESYELLQRSAAVPEGLIINEVSVDSFPPPKQEKDGWYDWVELKNNSGRDIELSDYYLSDDEDDLRFFRLPEMTLGSGELIVVYCSGETEGQAEGGIFAPFKLDSSNEQLYLSRGDGLADYVSLRDIPYRCTYGRVSGENGFFFLDAPTPGAENGMGYRRVTAAPVSLTADGIYENTESVSVELSGTGSIYYTLDSSVPTSAGTPYDGPVTVGETCVLRAIAVEDGCMPSRALTLSFFINEDLSLPALSIVTDDLDAFNFIYYQKKKGIEVPGNLAFYEQDGSFSIGCGIKMNGATSLELFKKNMSFRFRGSYGQERLSYDIFGGGVTEFSNLIVRAGQDYYSAIIRNEFAQELCLGATDKVVCQRSRYCVVFLNGRYHGIYALKDKTNEQMYADLAGVDKDSVILEEAHLPETSEFYNDVWLFCTENDMSLDENYSRFLSLVDVDSLIDWVIMEAYCCNDDLTAGNVRYVRSTEDDGKWRLVFYDLDSSFANPEKNYANLFSDTAVYVQQISKLLDALIRNGDFVDRLLTRAGYHLNHGLTNENAAAVIDRLAGEIRGEVERDCGRADMSLEHWERNVQYLRDFIVANDWRQHNIDALCELFSLTDAEREHYFGA